MGDELDRHFQRLGPCACCGTQDARHRVIDAIAERHAAGESVESLTEDYGVSGEAVRAALRTAADGLKGEGKGEL